MVQADVVIGLAGTLRVSFNGKPYSHRDMLCNLVIVLLPYGSRSNVQAVPAERQRFS
jgi:hypothetical protein